MPASLVAGGRPAAGSGWPKIISNLKSLLETGEVAILEPYPPGTSDAVKA